MKGRKEHFDGKKKGEFTKKKQDVQMQINRFLCSLGPTFAGWYAITINQHLINTVARGTLKLGCCVV